MKANNKLNQACNNSKGVKCNIQQEFGISKTAILKTPLKVLATKLIIKKTFGYLERRVSNAASHCLLSKRDKARIGYNSTTAYLVSLGAKFQPTPKRWITSEIRYMVEQFIFRVFKKVRGHRASKTFAENERKLQAAKIKPWKDIKYSHTFEEMKQFNKDYLRELSGKLDEWYSVLVKWSSEFRIKQYKKMMDARKYQAARRNLCNNHFQILRTMKKAKIYANSADKGIGNVIYSHKQYRDAVLQKLTDPTSYTVLDNTTKDAIFTEVKSEFKRLKLEFKDHAGISTALKAIEKGLEAHTSESSRLATLYPIFKLHKVQGKLDQLVELLDFIFPNRGVMPVINYMTSSMGQYLHSQFISAVNKHPNILINSRQLIAEIDRLEVTPNTLLFGADVEALYPSMEIEKCITAVDWFMRKYMNLPEDTMRFNLAILRIVLKRSYIEFEGKIYHQIKGVATGTISSVVVGNIYLLYCEEQVIGKFQTELQLYKRYLDDVMGVWTGYLSDLVDFREEMRKVCPEIKYEWQGYDKTSGEAFQVDKAQESKHMVLIALDSKITIPRSRKGKFTVEVYGKPLNIHSFIPRNSFHSKACRLGIWYGESLRFLILSSSFDIWLSKGAEFNLWITARGHKTEELMKAARRLKYGERKELLRRIREEPATMRDEKLKKLEEREKQTKGLFFTVRTTPNLKKFVKLLRPDLQELRKYSDGAEMFPETVTIVQRKPQTVGNWIPKQPAANDR